MVCHLYVVSQTTDLPPHGERLQILVADQGTVLAVGREIVVYPELLQVMQETSLFPRFIFPTEV